jgi:hypothetical protein
MRAFNLLAMRWRKVNGSELLPLVRAGVRFVDGLRETEDRCWRGEGEHRLTHAPIHNT